MQVVAERYRLDVPVARGGEGTLYRGTAVDTGEAIAVKEFRRGHPVAEACRSWDALIGLAPHDHLSGPTDVVDDGDRLYVVSRWVEGVSLDAVLARRPLTITEASTITNEVASALEHLHRSGVAHGDVTPANVMVRRPPASGAVLVDISPLGHRGTPGFVAPEVAAGAHPDAAADVFALTALFVAAITGRPPPLDPQNLPHCDARERERVHQLLERGLSPRPAARPAAIDLLRDICRCNEGRLPDHRSTSRFVGRDELVRHVLGLLREQKPVTVVAGGGYGKTRLALEVAQAPEAAFAGGAWVVELADLDAGDDVRGAVRRSLGIPDSPSLGRQLATEFPDGALLVLDNAEHVLEGTRGVIDELRREAPSLAILTTSRLALGARDEVVVHVPALPVPPADSPRWAVRDSPSVALFLDGVPSTATDRDDVIDDHLDDVAEVCRRVGGVPLALQLAASRFAAGSGSTTGILNELSERVLDVDHAGAVEPRHRTLRAVFDWSFALLPTSLQEAVPRLGVFRGSFDADAAAAVSGLQCEDLATLTSAGVLVRERGEPARHRVPEAVLEYLRRRLNADDPHAAVAQRHATWYAERVTALLHDSRRSAAGARWVDEEYDNVLAALEWTRVNGRADDLRRVVVSLYGYWQLRGRMADGSRWLHVAVEAMDVAPTEIAPEARVELLSHTGSFLARIGETTVGEELIRRGIGEARATDSPVAKGLVLLTYGGLLGTQGRLEEAEAVLTEALEHKRASGDIGGVAAILSNLGVIARRTGRSARGIELLEECVDLQREMGNRWGLAASLNNLANGYHEAGNLAAARALHEEALTLRRELGDIPGTATSLSNAGKIASEAGDLQGALLHHEQALELRRETGEQFELLDSLVEVSRLLVRLGDRRGALATAAEVASLAATLSQAGSAVEACALAARVTEGAAQTTFERLAATEAGGLDPNEVEEAFRASTGTAVA